MQDKWKITIVLSVIGALNYGNRTAIASVFPLLRADLGLSDIMLANVGSVFLFSYAVSSPIGGYLADRFSRTRMVLWGLIAWSIATALAGTVHGPEGLLITRALLGVAECTYIPASISLIADHHGPETRATALGLQTAGMSVGLIALGSIAGYMGQRFGWRIDMFILGAAGLLLALVSYFILYDAPRSETSKHDPADWKSILQLLRMPGYVTVISAAMLISIGTWMLMNWLPLYFYERFHLSLAMAGFSGSWALQVAAIVGAVVGGYISDRWAAGSPRRRMLLLAIGYICAAPFLSVFLLKASLGLINVSLFLYSFIRYTGAAGESPIIYELAGARLSASAIGILNLVNCVAGGLGILWAGLLRRDYGLGVAFGSLTLTIALAGVVVLIGYVLLGRQKGRMIPSPGLSIAARENGGP